MLTKRKKVEIKPVYVKVPKNLRPSKLPSYFMLDITAPGGEPGDEGDDIGPLYAYRNWYLNRTGCSLGYLNVSWSKCEKTDPGNRQPEYDFSELSISSRERKMKFIICNLESGGANWISPDQGIGPRWVEKPGFKFTVDKSGKKIVSQQYWRRLEHFIESSCRYVRNKFGVTIFSTGGNELDLVARETYHDFYPDWHFYYMAPVIHIHQAMKRAHPKNKLMIGNLCYTDRQHMEALYTAGAKGNFEILAIHNYGARGVYLDMNQILESHTAMVAQGDKHIGIVLTEGWSCFPLPEHIDKDPSNRQPGGRKYTPTDCEHYRQTVLDGWRNIMTPRPGEYDPRWVIGAKYFVLNDHWGGRGWEQRAVAKFEFRGKVHEVPATKYHGQGKIKSFKLDGYEIATDDPMWIKPVLRPWGLIDINGKPKGDIIFNFPPYLPKHRFTVSFTELLSDDKSVFAEKEYTVIVKFTNLEKSPIHQFKMSMLGRDEWERKISFGYISGMVKKSIIHPHETITSEYTVTYPVELIGLVKGGYPRRIRGYADAVYYWQGRLYHTDAWLPNVLVTK